MEEILMVKTNDGKLHDTLDIAKRHDLDRLCTIMDSRLNPLLGGYTRNDIYKLISFMFADYDSSKKFIEDLYKVLD